jgi:PAS domain S-box-containing protein
MSELGSLLTYLRDPKLAAHATSALPVWLWSVDATEVLWVNPTAAAIFDVPSPAALAGYTIDPKGSAALQIARIAGTLQQGGAVRLERLRGFGGNLGRTLTCACSRIVLADRRPAVLVAAAEPAGPGLPLDERIRRLSIGIDEPVAFFFPDGELIHATSAGEARLNGLKSIAALGASALVDRALAQGQAAGASHLGAIQVERIGTEVSTVLLVMLAEAVQPAAQDAVDTPAADTTAIDTPAEPMPAAPAEPPAAEPSSPAATATPDEPVPPKPADTAPRAPRADRPLRFVWQMDADGRITLGADDFADVIGPQSAAALRRPWREIAGELGLDPGKQIERAIASQDTWSGIEVAFPVDGTDQRLPVELSALPVFDRERNFRGYRGFGICRQAPAAPTAPAQQAEPEATSAEPAAPERTDDAPAPPPRYEPPVLREERPTLTVVPAVENVLPFRTAPQPSDKDKSPSLTPVERRAFRELASKLTARLREAQNGAANGATTLDMTEPEFPALPQPPAARSEPPAAASPPADAPAIGSDQRPILDRLPIGVLVYRLDRLLYANRAFLDWTGYDSIHALSDAGGLDALFIEPGTDAPGQNGARTLSITTSNGNQLPIEARLFSTPWDGESALVLMLAGSAPAAAAAQGGTPEKAASAAESQAKELRAILDISADGVVLIDRDGRVVSMNRSAETLFGHQSREVAGLPFAGLFAPESQRDAFEALDTTSRDGVAGQLDEGRELRARGRDGVALPLFMTIGKVAGGDKLAAVFRNLAAWKHAEVELLNAKRQAESASSAKSEFLAKISHEIRTPLNAIIGFSEVMMEERFGPVGNERYKQYLRDIHTSGEHLISLLNDLLDLSKIEAGKLDLDVTALDLNELTQQCVALMQPQANRERIIIRTALSSSLPPVLADARSVRQIALNLLSNSIKFTGAGGQVIVSTAVNDGGEVVLRVRDTGTGMSEKEIAIAMEPFRQLATSARFGSGGTGLGLPLTKALAEANRATFSIKSAVNAGTLVEVAFSGKPMAAE